MDFQTKIDALQGKIDYLQSKQADFQKYIINLQKELDALKEENFSNSTLEKNIVSDINQLVKAENTLQKEVNTPIIPLVKKQQIKERFSDKIKKEIGFDWNIKSDFENFIGTNLINKIGILILIFGVIVGAKYAIDNELISPLTRIIIGYGISFALLVFSIKLRAKYLNFSAVLLSGSLAMLYFLSYISYDFYNFISQAIAFLLMFIFTIFAVVASISYNKQIIALIGLVGSYAIPFLLSNQSGNVLFLFSYMSIVNSGILFLSFKKNWKLLYYTSFIFTWLIYVFWIFEKFDSTQHFTLAIIFASIFYIIFYISFLAYKLIKKELFVKSDIIFIMLNSFIFYSIGISIMNSTSFGRQYLGLFTVLNAIIHFVVSKIIFNQKDADKKLFYLASVMVLVFITLAIPVQFDGTWTTIFWSIEAALLFWIGRSKQIPIYEKISYTLIFLAFFSLLDDWDKNYSYRSITPFFNLTFVTALLSSISFGFISKLIYDKKYPIPSFLLEESNLIKKTINYYYKAIKYIVPALFMIVLYFTFHKEISEYFNNIFELSKIDFINGEYKDYTYNYDITDFKSFWLIIYSFIFFLIASFVNLKFLKNKKIGQLNIVFNMGLLFISLSVGLMICSDLRESYLSIAEQNDFYSKGIEYMIIRYVNYIFIALMVFTIYKLIKEFITHKKAIQFFWLGFHVVVLWILSSELLHWMDFYGNKHAYKISLTILWASYSLLAVSLGIWKKLKYLRVGAISLFGLTLVKLFIYDLAHLSTIQKTIVLISVGFLLLIVSFLYNKYTNVINENHQK